MQKIVTLFTPRLFLPASTPLLAALDQGNTFFSVNTVPPSGSLY